MAKPVAVQQVRVIPVAVEDAFAETLPIDLPKIMTQWYGAIPPIKEVREQSGAWDAAGQTRVLVLVGGGRVREKLTSVDPPRSFDYTLSDIKGPLALLVRSVDGRWSFAPAGDETTVSWQWTLHPRSELSAPLLPLFAKMWQGYARVVLEKLAAQLV